MTAHAGALEPVGRILDRGGDADDVLREVLAALQANGIPYAAVRFLEEGRLVEGPSIGEPADALTVPVTYEGAPVGELELAVGDQAFAERLADLISPYVLVGWDTGGEQWNP